MPFKKTLFLLLTVAFHSSVFADFPDKGFTEYILHFGKPVKLEDGINLSSTHYYWLPKIEIHRNLGELKNINFRGTYLCHSDFDETDFINCNFREANLAYVYAPSSGFEDCDFTDAIIAGGDINLSREQFLSTASFKQKRLPRYHFRGDFSGIDFSEFDLKGAYFLFAKIDGCDFSNAEIAGAHWTDSLSRDQLLSTSDFRRRELIGIYFTSYDFTEMDLSKMNLFSCVFHPPALVRGVKCNFHNVDLSDSVISQCDFRSTKNLTLAQIKSTWNYKVGRMEGIKLPKELQEALDAEKKAKEQQTDKN